MCYTFDALETCVPQMVELLVDCVRNPFFLDWEINEQENYTAPRMVLAASGVEPEEILSTVELLLSDLPSVPCPPAPKSAYIGGDYHFHTESGRTHFALAFELPDGWHYLKHTMMLMGGGGSFSAGEPGKGMYSWLYLRVLNEYPQVHSTSAFNNIYNNSGIFGIQVTTDSNFVSKAIDVAANELLMVATPGQVDQVQLNCANRLQNLLF